jgi:3',5'-cyclic AMP phosphodiesterase CpdA
MRILHFSDVHLDPDLREVPAAKWLGKRAIGGLNLMLRRKRFFRDAGRKIAALAKFRREIDADLVVCTGDYTHFGLEFEMAAARAAVEPLMDAPLGFVCVPGNHDLYLADSVNEGIFERHFGETLRGDLDTGGKSAGPWPLVRLPDEHVAVVAVNSARPNPAPWRSSGVVGKTQLAALRALAADPRLRERFVFVALHYAPRLWNGRPDSVRHGLVDGEAFLDECGRFPRAALLCGHVHRNYSVRLPDHGLTQFCGGSATMAGREGIWVFDVTGARVLATPGRWDGSRYALTPGSAVDA